MTGFYATGEVAIGSTGNAGTSTPVSKVTDVTVTPATATLTGAPVDFDWIINGTNSPSQAATVTTSLGTITPSGVLTVAQTSSVQNGTVTVTSTQDPTKSGTATFTVAALTDTTAPTVTAASATATGPNTATGTVTTNEMGGLLYWLVNASATATEAQVLAGSSKAVTVAGQQSVSLAGLPSASTLYLHFLHADGAATPNRSAVANTASFTTSAASDTTGPVMQGEISFTKTATTTDIAWPAATDAGGVAEYFVSKDGGAAVSTGTARTKSFAGLAPLSAHLYEITARDTAGNISSNSISVTVVTDAASEDPSLVQKTIQVTLKARNLDLQANAAGINWTWSDARGTVTSSGTGLVASAAGVLSIPIRTRLLSDGVGMLTLDNYNGGNALTYFGYTGPVRVP